MNSMERFDSFKTMEHRIKDHPQFKAAPNDFIVFIFIWNGIIVNIKKNSNCSEKKKPGSRLSVLLRPISAGCQGNSWRVGFERERSRSRSAWRQLRLNGYPGGVISAHTSHLTSLVDPGPARGLKHFLPAPQIGHFQSSCRSSKRVPLGIFPFLSPLSGL
jgi:hypothetical protein